MPLALLLSMLLMRRPLTSLHKICIPEILKAKWCSAVQLMCKPQFQLGIVIQISSFMSVSQLNSKIPRPNSKIFAKPNPT